MKSFEYASARSVDEAIGLMTEGASFKAGGVDLLDLMKERIAQPERLVNIRNIPGLNKIEESDGVLKIGPLVTLAELSESELVRTKYTAIAQAALGAATPQVRNMATAGGNLLQRPRCWYFRNEAFPCRKKGGEICYAQEGENQYHAIYNNRLCAIVHPSALATPLVALGASITVNNGKDAREVKLDDFFVLPSSSLHRENKLGEREIITEIRVPAPPAGAKSFYIKQMEKQSFDWPVAEVAAVLELDGENVKAASVVMGAAAPVPHRAREVEKALIGKPLTDESLSAAIKAELSLATPFDANAYKLRVFEASIARTLLNCR